MQKRKILFLGETYRADALTWMNGLKEFGGFEITTWELQSSSNTKMQRVFRFIEFYTALLKIRKLIKREKPDMVIAERTTSYGFLAAISNIHPVAIAQQGKTDLWPENSISLPLKKFLQNYAFQHADLIHAWGPIMASHMQRVNVDMKKVLVLPKGIDLEKFQFKTLSQNNQKITAVVTRSLLPEYRHEVILQAFAKIKQKNMDFSLLIVGNGTQKSRLETLASTLDISNKVTFLGRIDNTALPSILQKSAFYISMPNTEGVSASLFEAMACGCYPIVTDIEGNQSWIQHRKNGQLIPVDDADFLAKEVLWAFDNPDHRTKAVIQNRKFVEEKANYSINMKVIAKQYHELITEFEQKK
jgi:glycosyltransferase involved in cell wall biosynthesis